MTELNRTCSPDTLVHIREGGKTIKMIEIAICDDQIEFARQLSESIKRICSDECVGSEQVHICGLFPSAEELLETLPDQKIDILFLDIEMDGMSGFQLAEIFHRESPKTVLLFVSSHDDMVYLSLRFAPFRFLRKAKLSEELKDALKDALTEAIHLKEPRGKTLLLRTNDGMIHIPLDEIVYLESSSNYLLVFRDGAGKPYKTRGTLKKFVSELPEGSSFVRIHSAFVINIEKLQKIGSSSFVTMKGNISLPIGRKWKQEVRSAYLDYVKNTLFC